MTDLNRRSFLKQTSVGAATLGLLSALPALAPIPNLAQPAKSETPAIKISGPLIVQVTDAASGEIALFTGGREIVFHDPDLVSRLVKAAR